MSQSLTLALLGCGQIGGSLALALRATGEAITIVGFDRSAQHGDILIQKGAIDRFAPTAREAVSGADIVLLAVPLGSYQTVMRSCADALLPTAIVTDVGSVKQTMLALKPLLPTGVELVPGHPISGSERTGPDAARLDLYKDKLCVLTPEEGTDPRAVAIIRTLWEMTGAIVREMPAGVHDQLYAYVSHLPHVIAFVSARAFYRLQLQSLSAEEDAALARYLRISRSDPRMWTDVFIENRDSLLQGLAMYLAVLTHMAEELRSGEAGAEAERLEVAKTALPRLLASALISTVSLYEQQSNLNVRAFGAGGLRDIASPAAETPEEATAYISHHAAIVAGLLEETLALFTPLKDAIEAADAEALHALLNEMQAEAVAIHRPKQ